MIRLAKLRELSFHEWKILLGSLFLLPYVALLLKLTGYGKTRKFFPAPITISKGMSQELQMNKAQQISRLVDAAARHGFYHANCLKRSLVLAWFLRRHGIPFELRIGTRKTTGSEKEMQHFSAHAWIESNGVVVNENENVNERFTPFDGHIDS